LPLVTSGTCAWMREMHAQKRFWCRCSQRKREAGNSIEPVWNRRDCISGAVKLPSFIGRRLCVLLAAAYGGSKNIMAMETGRAAASAVLAASVGNPPAPIV
jgi:hypothetical protein